MNLDEKEFQDLAKKYKIQYEEDTKFLLDHGWKKKNDDPQCILYVSPKGETYGHHYGLFMENGERLAIKVAKNDIVLRSFVQFQVQVFNDEEEPKNLRGTDEPIDFFFPCIKDCKLYWYDEAVSLAVYGLNITFEWDRWLKLKKELEKLDLTKIQQSDIIKVEESWSESSGSMFKLRN